jgi:ankyrin repeat protein
MNGGWNALHSAALRGYVAIIETLLERRWRANIELRGAYNKTALIWAAEIGQNGSVRTLLSRNANVKARDALQKVACIMRPQTGTSMS